MTDAEDGTPKFAGYSGLTGSGRPASGRSGPAPPDSLPALGWRGHGSCLFCASTDTVWQHDLSGSLARFRTIFGQGHVWGGSHTLCDPCEQLYRDGDYGALARLQAEKPDGFDRAFDDNLVALAAFCRADRGPRELAEPAFPAGFEPVDELTGAEWIVELWPAQHLASTAGTRWSQIADDPAARIWLVRSPWPSLRLLEAFRVIWSWVDRDDDPTPPADKVRRSRAAEVLAWTDAEAVARLRRQDDQGGGRAAG